MLNLVFAQKTDPGSVRGNNEDALGYVAPSTPAEVQSQGWMFALADGMGGHAHGELASRLAVEAALTGFRNIPKGVMHVSLLPKLVQEANVAVLDGASQDAESGKPRMGTTLVLCALRFGSAVVSHVGDSRCYLHRDGRAVQLTRDHTVAAEHLRLGLVTKTAAESAESRHVLTRSLGSEMFVAADTTTVDLVPKDTLLLCSDGLHGCVQDDRMAEILQGSPDLEVAADTLVSEALRNGSTDNVSVQLIRILSVERMGLYRGRPYRLL